MQEPLVSVIVPVYNVEEYLEECFLSIKNQTYGNIEIILVNDGSTDNSGELANKLAAADKRARVIHKKNGGLSDARNTGTADSKGEWVTFIDSDDTIHENFVEILISAALDNDSDIAQCDNSRKIEELGKGSEKNNTLSGKNAFVELMKYKEISPTAWGKLYKKSIFTDNSLEFPVGRIHEDTAVLYKIIYFANKITCVDKVMYYYRMNNNSITTASYTDRHYGSVVDYHDELDAFIDENNILISERVVDRHKALRFLSILNKMALRNQEHTGVYRELRLECIGFSWRSRNLVCMAGIFPASLPFIFRGLNRITPLVRKVLGKL